MLEKRLYSSADGVEHIGILPSGEMYVDREVAGDDMPDAALTDYVAPDDVARLKSLLAMGGAMTDAELLDRLAARFKRGADVLKWLRASGIPTAPRSDEGMLRDPSMINPSSAGVRAVSREFAPGTRFYDVGGVPVALEPARSAALTVWAVDPRRREFSLASVYRSGVEIPSERFDELVGTFAEAPPARQDDDRGARMHFAPGTGFYEVEGLPVTLEPAPAGGAAARAFDPTPRYFPVNAVARNGTEISRETFEDMVEECRGAQSLKFAPAVWPAED